MGSEYLVQGWISTAITFSGSEYNGYWVELYRGDQEHKAFDVLRAGKNKYPLIELQWRPEA